MRRRRSMGIGPPDEAKRSSRFSLSVPPLPAGSRRRRRVRAAGGATRCESREPEKVAVVDEVRDASRAASSAAILTEYRGLAVAELADAAPGACARPAASTRSTRTPSSAARSADDRTRRSSSRCSSARPAIAFVDGDVVAVAKVLRDFARTNPNLVVKGGLVGASLLDARSAAALRRPAVREVLLAQIAGCLPRRCSSSPACSQALPQNLAYGLQALIERGRVAERPPRRQRRPIDAEATETPAEAEAEAEAPADAAEAEPADARCRRQPTPKRRERRGTRRQSLPERRGRDSGVRAAEAAAEQAEPAEAAAEQSEPAEAAAAVRAGSGRSGDRSSPSRRRPRRDGGGRRRGGRARDGAVRAEVAGSDEQADGRRTDWDADAGAGSASLRPTERTQRKERGTMATKEEILDGIASDDRSRALRAVEGVRGALRRHRGRTGRGRRGSLRPAAAAAARLPPRSRTSSTSSSPPLATRRSRSSRRSVRSRALA